MSAPYDRPRPVRHLVIIESAGKITALQAALRRSPISDCYILATGGHIMELPASLDDIGLDQRLAEVGREPRFPEQIAKIRAWARSAERVLLACDADAEGDVLAWDLAQVLEEVGHRNIARVRLRSLDVEGVLHAFRHAQPVCERDAWPGAARRMLDRLIGSALGERSRDAVELSVGRVQSALLGAAAGQPVAFGLAQIALPSCDGRDPFVATLEVTEHNLQAVRELLARADEFAKAGGCVTLGSSRPAPQPKPWTFGEAVQSISQTTQAPIGEVAQSLQRLYEAGKLSYPRSDAAGVTPQGVATLRQLAERHGVRIDTAQLPGFARKGPHAHESPRPLSDDVNLTAPLRLLSKDDAALSLLSRNLLSCAQPHAVHSPRDQDLPEWARGLKFEREVCQWLRPWARKPIQTGLRLYSSEEMALGLLLKHRLGRPSTQVFHATKFASRGLMDAQGSLTPRAHDWLARTPASLLDPKISTSIEQALAVCGDTADGEPPAALVRQVLESLSLWPAVQQALDRYSHQLGSAAQGLSGAMA